MRLADFNLQIIESHETREESMGKKKKKKKKSRNTPLRDQEKRQMKKCNREQEIEAGDV